MRWWLILCGAGLVASPPGGLIAQGDQFDFYPTAAARALAAPPESALKVVCERELKGSDLAEPYRGLRLAAVGARPPQVLLVVFNRKGIGNLRQAIALRVRYAPMPTARPGASGTLDWGYVYDRNGDGRVDYLVFLQNAHPLLPDPLPPDVPEVERLSDGRIRGTQALLHAVINEATMVFRHYADDDFDGRVDGAVVEEFDPVRPLFVRGWIVLHGRGTGAAVDQAWAFRHGIRDTTRVLERGDSGYMVPGIDPLGPLIPVGPMLDRASERLAAINAGLALCRLPVGALDRGDQGEAAASRSRPEAKDR